MTDDDEEGSSLAAGAVVGRYEIKRLLGRGGMGEVYEAVHLDLKKRVAIKTLRSGGASADTRARFSREGEAAARIQHPHIVGVTDVGAHEGMPYLVMEYLEGEDLGALLEREGALEPTRIADVLIPVTAAVSAAHEARVLHRDLKPSNIFLAATGDGGVHPRVLDFGVSKLLDGVERLTQSGAMMGTPVYVAPEQSRGARFVDERSDQYALGVILYECATGRVPFETDSLFQLLHNIVHGEYPPPRAVRPELSADFEAVILRAMALDPGQRFASVRELTRALLPFASEETRVVWRRVVGSAPIAPPPPAPPAPPVSSSASPRDSSGTGTGVAASTMERIGVERPTPQRVEGRSRRQVVALVTVAALGAVGIAWGLRGERARDSSTRAAAPVVTPLRPEATQARPEAPTPVPAPAPPAAPVAPATLDPARPQSAPGTQDTALTPGGESGASPHAGAPAAHGAARPSGAAPRAVGARHAHTPGTPSAPSTSSTPGATGATGVMSDYEAHP